MELPGDKEEDEQMMTVPKALEILAALLLGGEEDHDEEDEGHDPASCAWTCGKVRFEEVAKSFACGCALVDVGEPGKVDHVCENVYGGEGDDGPRSGLVERDVLVEGDDIVERSPTEERDEVTANWKQNKGGVDVQYEGGATGDR